MVFSATFVNFIVLAMIPRLTLQAVLSIPLERIELPRTHNSYNISERAQTVGPTSVVPLTRTSALLWAGEIQIGTGATQKSFHVTFDTAATDTLIWSANYKPTSGALLDHEVTVQFGDGDSGTGTPYADAVTVGSFTVAQQSLIASTTSSASLQSDGTDGNFGMGFPFLSEITEISTKQQQSFFQNYLDGHPDVGKIFSFYTGTLAGTSPTLTFGGDYQNPNFNVDLSTINKLVVLNSATDDATDWKVGVTKATFTQNQNIVHTTAATYALIDTAHTQISIPGSDFNEFVKYLPGFQMEEHEDGTTDYRISCAGNFPSIQIYFVGDGTAFTIDETVYKGAQVSTGICDLLLAPEDLGNYWNLGSTFLQTVYARFTVGRPKNDQIENDVGTLSYIGFVRLPKPVAAPAPVPAGPSTPPT